MTYSVTLSVSGAGLAFLDEITYSVNASDADEAEAKARKRAKSEYMAVRRTVTVKQVS